MILRLVGDTTFNLNDIGNGIAVASSGYKPAVARPSTKLSSGGIYRDVEDTIPLEIWGDTYNDVVSKLLALTKIMDQARRWKDTNGIGVTPIVLEWSPTASAADPLKWLILGSDSNLITYVGDIDKSLQGYTLSFDLEIMRRGEGLLVDTPVVGTAGDISTKHQIDLLTPTSGITAYADVKLATDYPSLFGNRTLSEGYLLWSAIQNSVVLSGTNFGTLTNDSNAYQGFYSESDQPTFVALGSGGQPTLPAGTYQWFIALQGDAGVSWRITPITNLESSDTRHRPEIITCTGGKQIIAGSLVSLRAPCVQHFFEFEAIDQDAETFYMAIDRFVWVSVGEASGVIRIVEKQIDLATVTDLSLEIKNNLLTRRGGEAYYSHSGGTIYIPSAGIGDLTILAPNQYLELLWLAVGDEWTILNDDLTELQITPTVTRYNAHLTPI